MAFELEASNPATFYVLYILHDISFAAGILAFWFGADVVVRWCMSKKWFEWVTAFSFVIYALHVPLIHYTTRLAFIFLHNFKYYRLVTYLVVPVIIFFTCLAFGAAFRRLFPKAYRIACGGRGF